MLDKICRALRLTTNAYDEELQSLQQAALLDLQIAGVVTESGDALIERAVITYVRMHFGTPDDYDRLKASYRGLMMLDEIRAIWNLPPLPDDKGQVFIIRGEYHNAFDQVTEGSADNAD